ncbi:hypothetical protein CLAIMM_13670, partial [Cladophialophora immunda]
MGGMQVHYCPATLPPDIKQTPVSRGDRPEQMVEGYLAALNLEEHLLLDATSELEMRDKDRADNLVKGLLAFQVLRLATQCTARTAEDLPITPLEISPVAHVPFMMLSMFILWRNTYNVEIPTMIGASLFSDQGLDLVTKYLDLSVEPVVQAHPLPIVWSGKRVFEGYWERNIRTYSSRRCRGRVFFVVGGLHGSAWNS